MDLHRWTDLMHQFGFDENTQTFNMLVDAYSESHRCYHNRDHIDDCLNKLDQVSRKEAYLREIEISIWFHDAVYAPYSKSNEKDSASMAADFLNANAASSETIDMVSDLIMATCHNSPVNNEAESVLVDIDLSILGSESEKYLQYANSIRGEYKLIPAILYRNKRKAVLRQFLERPRIFHTELFFGQYEQQARKNIASEIAAL